VCLSPSSACDWPPHETPHAFNILYQRLLSRYDSSMRTDHIGKHPHVTPPPLW
jgi:hypothetical protein